MGNKNSGAREKENLSGKRYGKLLVIKRAENYLYKDGRFRIRYLVKCDCGKEFETHKDNLTRGDSKSCGCWRDEKLSNQRWSGYEEISLTYLNGIIAGAKKRNMEYSLTNEFIWNLFIKQNRKCALSGYDLAFSRDIRKVRALQTACLDRIDSSKGYTEDNVWWVHKDMNTLKWDWSLDKFYQMCQDVVDHKNRPK